MRVVFGRLILALVGYVSLCSVAFAQLKFDKAQLAQLEALERQILYHPRKYAAADVDKFIGDAGRRIEFTTKQGRQVAWLIPPANGAAPEKLWICCGGNGTLALDLEPLCRALPLGADAFLLVDYPGYGLCAGSPSPLDIRETMKVSVLQATKELKIDAAKLPQRVCVFGHSLGCAATLLAVEEFHLRRAVLCAPFTDTREVAQEKMGIPKEFPVQHKFDTRPGLKELAQNKGRAWIFHGDQDDIIPVEMSKTLAREFKDTVSLHVVAGAGHNDVIGRALNELTAAMQDARK
jgi:pimeloyl-ACP methyl ester carboxylesterase